MHAVFSRTLTGPAQMRDAIATHIKALGKEINARVGGTSENENGAAEGSSPPPIPGSTEYLGIVLGGSGVSGGNPFEWVKEVLSLKDKYDRILEVAVGKDRGFQTAFNEVFKDCI